MWIALLFLACTQGNDEVDDTTDTAGSVPACDLYQYQSVQDGLVSRCEDATAPWDSPATPGAASGHMTLRWIPRCADGTDACTPDLEVRCLDGTRGAYHVDPAECLSEGTCSEADGWTFFFQGGGTCKDFESCHAAYVDPAQLGETSTAHPSGRTVDDHVRGDGVLSEREDNTFGRTHRVKLAKCGFDRFLGDTSVLTTSDDGTDVWLHFHGRRMIRAVLADLGRTAETVTVDGVTLPDFDDAGQVLITANSGGSGGLIQNLDWLAAEITARAPGARVVGVIDARLQPNGETEAAFEVGGDCDADCDAYDFDRVGVSEVEADAPLAPALSLTRGTAHYEPGGQTEGMMRAFLPDGVAAHDASCAAVHAADPAPCYDEQHVLFNHVAAPVFLHEALFDGNHRTRGLTEWVAEPEGFLWDPYTWARAGRVVLHADTLLEERGRADGTPPSRVGVFLPGHSQHVSVVDDAHFFDGALCRGCGTPNATCTSFHDALRAWLPGSGDQAWVEERPRVPGQPTTTAPLSHTMTDATSVGWTWSPSGTCPSSRRGAQAARGG